MTVFLPEYKPDWQSAADAVAACPVHAVTPLREVEFDGVAVLIKEESARFGIGSFKALGGVYAVLESARDLHAGKGGPRPGIEELFSDAYRSLQRDMQFVCASAGNHGIAVATGARLLGAKARIHLSAEVPEDFVARLNERGGDAVRSGVTYEESLDAALADARESNATLVADTAWEGYVDIPTLIMAGYSVIGEELRVAFERHGRWPSDVYLQAGVGGLAGAMTWMIRQRWPVQPRIVIVEPAAATCLASSHEAGMPVTVDGPVSSMGRLDCKTASPLAFDALKDANVEYLAVEDSAVEACVMELADNGLSSTPSGSAGFAGWRLEHERGACAGDRPLVILSETGLG